MSKKIKKSKYPEGYIGRPKPMKTKTFEFHKPGVKFWISLGFTVAVIGFLTYIVIRLVNVGKVIQPQFDYYEFSQSKKASDYVLENESLRFEMNPATTGFTVLQKNTGRRRIRHRHGARAGDRLRQKPEIHRGGHRVSALQKVLRREISRIP